MKLLFSVLCIFLIIGFGYGQGVVRTVPTWHDGEFIFGTAGAYAVLGDNGDGADTSSVFCAKEWKEAILWMRSDTTSADVSGVSDSCLTVILQHKDADFGWGGLYSESTANYTVIDTVARSFINVGGTNYYYMDLSGDGAWVPADSTRIIFQCGVGDSLNFKAKITGQ